MQNLGGSVIRGDYEEITFVVMDPEGTPRDITTDVIRVSGKTRATYSEYVFQKSSETDGVIKTAPLEGAAKVVLEPDDLAAVLFDTTLYCDVEVTDAQGRPSTTLFTVPVELDIT